MPRLVLVFFCFFALLAPVIMLLLFNLLDVDVGIQELLLNRKVF